MTPRPAPRTAALVALACAAALLFAAPAAHAANQTWTVTGPTDSNLFDNGNFVNGATTFTLVVTVDDAAPDQDPDPNVGQYPVTASLTFGTVVETVPAEVTISNDLTGSGVTADTLQIQSTGPAPAGWDSFLVQLGLMDDTASIFINDALPAPGFDETDFGFRIFGLNAIALGGSTGVIAQSDIDSLTTPEPTSAAAAALLGLVAFTRRRAI